MWLPLNALQMPLRGAVGSQLLPVAERRGEGIRRCCICLAEWLVGTARCAVRAPSDGRIH